MAIQIRRGASTDFDASKMVAGELGVATDDSHKLWATGQAGDSWELANKEDLDAEVEAREALAETVEAQGESLDTKAEVNGTYDNLVAGNLLSDEMQTDSAPYLFRPTGGGLQRIGERCYPVLVGASVAENQLFYERETQTKNGITLTNNGDGSYTLNGTSTARVQFTGSAGVMSVGANHKILMLANGVSGTCDKKFAMFFYFQTDSGTDYPSLNIFASGAIERTAIIYNTYKSGTITASGMILDIELTDTTCANLKFTPQVIDLTALLGSTIADYVYQLETATAGSGIAWLRSYGFLGGYVPYNSGSIESVEVTEKKCVGFNQWDEEWENGYYNRATGAKAGNTNTSYIRSKNLIPCLPSTRYYYKPPVVHAQNSTYYAILYYDADNNYIGCDMVSGNASLTSVTPNNARYLTFYCEIGTSGSTYQNDICINLSSSRNGEYEPYTSQTYSLGNDTLRGIFKLDASNNIYADGDRKEADGTITRRYGVVDLGTLTWTKSPRRPSRFYTSNPPSYSFGDASFLCSKYLFIGAGSSDDWYPTADKAFNYFHRTQTINPCELYFHDESASSMTAEQFKASLSGVYLVYALQTPTTEISTPFPSPQVCYPDGTEEYVTSNGVPVGHETSYPYDLKALVEGLIDVPDVPSANGTYVLKATRSADGISYTWVADSAVSLASPLTSAPPQTTTDESDDSQESDESEEEGETE